VDWVGPFLFMTSNPIIPTMVGATPWEDAHAYAELSAIYGLDRVTTPVLLADGDDDGFILLTDIEMYNGLRYLDKKVTFLRYPKQGHGFTGAARTDFWKRENAFFDKYLKPEQPPS
jgi:dipeptidyl aminopeptidase/acylaminoacyl peptidase